MNVRQALIDTLNYLSSLNWQIIVHGSWVICYNCGESYDTTVHSSACPHAPLSSK